MTTPLPEWMPQLPEPWETKKYGTQLFDADQMLDFGRQCVEDYKKSLKPVAWVAVGHENITLDEDQAAQWSDMGARVVPLYRLDEGQT